MLSGNIDLSVATFVCSNFSDKSQHYITNELFVTQDSTDRILAENRTKKSFDEPPLIVGELNEVEMQFFVIQQSLKKRIDGTRKRMGEINEVSVLASTRTIDAAKAKYYERSARLDELLEEYRMVYHLLNRTILERLKDVVNMALEQNPKLFKKLCNAYDSGFDFEIIDKKTIILTNYYQMPGD